MSVSRRQMIKGTAVGMAAGVLASKALLANSSPIKSGGNELDVIVIGAGFAGLTAARDCAKKGYRVLLLEARGRIGGRTYDMDFDGDHIEYGGTWIHWTQGYVWAEFARYGLTLKESPALVPGSASWISQGKLHEGQAADFYGKMIEGITAFSDVDGQGGRTVFPRPYDPFFNEQLVRQLDKLSLADRLREMKGSPELKDITAGLMAMGCASPLEQGAFLDWIKWWALNDYDFGHLGDRQARFKIKEGTGALANAILNDASVKLQVNEPVSEVQQVEGGVIVRTSTGTYRAGAVVAAVPLAVLDSIKFTPSLNTVKRGASQTGNTTTGRKVYFKLKEDIGAWTGVAAPPNPVTYAFTENTVSPGSLIVSFCYPGDIDFHNVTEAQRALRTLLPDVNVVATRCHDWTADPYSRAEWCWFRPGTLTGTFNELSRPEGRIHFASGDIAQGWRGFIDGAIESGMLAARQVDEQLSKQTTTKASAGA
ncbi:FAD-dependent oxidoreductase [Pseudomonas sp. BN411]|nr:FAD-dependent oxidoreductase [Pseudomonas sp. BN411]